jgi:hypothetical protein
MVAGLSAMPNEGNLSVLQDWTRRLTLMQQAVLLTAVRGPDGVRRDHPTKLIIRFFRRCFLHTGMEEVKTRWVPYNSKTEPSWGISFTGPSINQEEVGPHGE